ncbi:MAG: hypothetical protein H3Z50_00505 [archaeon]|nr:hypothetical protein [archaeon]MCP8305692.1 hypothetical protein [archaeon]
MPKKRKTKKKGRPRKKTREALKDHEACQQAGQEQRRSFAGSLGEGETVNAG